MLISVVLIFWAFTIIFFYCEFGEMVTQEFIAFDEVLCQCDWYKFPIDLQRMLAIFILDTQQPTFICGYGGIQCARDAFKNVNIFFKNSIWIQILEFSLLFFFISCFLDCTWWIILFYDASTNWRVNIRLSRSWFSYCRFRIFQPILILIVFQMFSNEKFH